MFSGIVEEIGSVLNVSQTADGQRLRIGARLMIDGLKVGDSIAVNGICLTNIAHSSDWFEVEATTETLNRTKLGQIKAGAEVNLERALRMGDRLGGHLVSGHIDCTGTVAEIANEGFSKIITFQLERSYAPYFIDKGSAAIDGVSLTVVQPQSNQDHTRFSVALIPHTLAVTTLDELKVGDMVNIECDLVAKYILHAAGPYVSILSNHACPDVLQNPSTQNQKKQAELSMTFLQENGFVIS
jgi:riboflavin synthase